MQLHLVGQRKQSGTNIAVFRLESDSKKPVSIIGPGEIIARGKVRRAEWAWPYRGPVKMVEAVEVEVIAPPEDVWKYRMYIYRPQPASQKLKDAWAEATQLSIHGVKSVWTRPQLYIAEWVEGEYVTNPPPRHD